MSVPHWRYVNYTDDGCSIYQCLNCYNKWEARTAPGRYDPYEYIDEPVSGCTVVKRGDGTHYYFLERDIPLYKEGWKFCPHCGCEWDGAIVPDYDNEYMYQGRRLEVYRMVKNLPYSSSQPDWYWLIQERQVWADRDGPEDWKGFRKYDPRRYSALDIYKELQWVRENRFDYSNRLFAITDECRAIKITPEEAERTYRWL